MIERKKMCFTYIIRCKDDTLYTGYTTDIYRRIEEHKKGINSKYTKAKGFKCLEVCFSSDTKSQAMKLEYYIKKLSRAKKNSIISNPEIFLLNLQIKDKDIYQTISVIE